MSLFEAVLGVPLAAKSRTRPALWLRLGGFFSAAALVWSALAAYHFINYYHGFLSPSAQIALFYLAIAYSLCFAAFYVWAPLAAVKQSKGLLTVTALKKIVMGIGSFVTSGPRDYTHPLSRLDKIEKRALLFSLVKLFFIPIMVQFAIGNYSDLRQSFANSQSWGSLFSLNGFNNYLYPLLLTLFLLVDTAFYTFGYIVETKFLNSRIRSVEPTVLGWFVALICYPPFNGLLSNYAAWHANDYAVFGSVWATFVLRLAGILLMGFYASASVALGPKASNLTNRGIVGYGPYRVVRHPAYISKNLAWWITIIPVISPAAVLSMGVWSFVYFMRAITEERHLSADPDYVAYCQKVKYRFIPGVV